MTKLTEKSINVYILQYQINASSNIFHGGFNKTTLMLKMLVHFFKNLLVKGREVYMAKLEQPTL